MSAGKITRKLWLNAETDKAVMVGPEPLHRARSNRWLPRSMIEIEARETVRNPRFGTAPHIAEILGTMVTIKAPAFVLARSGLNRDAEIGR